MPLTKDDVIRAWKDESYRDSLAAEDRNALPESPGNMGELSDDQLETAAGAFTPALGLAVVSTYGYSMMHPESAK